jgi:chitin synthase
MIIPLIYYVCIVIWIPRGILARVQYLVGCVIYIFCGPFINICILLYACYHMDSFDWGKTRKVCTEESTGVRSYASTDNAAEMGPQEETSTDTLQD